jgi:hypothetical protein
MDMEKLRKQALAKNDPKLREQMLLEEKIEQLTQRIEELEKTNGVFKKYIRSNIAPKDYKWRQLYENLCNEQIADGKKVPNSDK